jgi:hypothetical protein
MMIWPSLPNVLSNLPWRFSGISRASLARLLGAAVFLAYSIAVALGSGVDELVTILGISLTTAQRVLIGTAVFGALLLWDNLSLRTRLTRHTDAPFIGWLYPSAEMFQDGTFLLRVECENSGPRDSEAVTLSAYAESSHMAESPLAIPIAVWSRILSRKNGDQHRFTVEIRSLPTSGSPWFGQREIQWGLYYFDGANREHTYLSAASVVVGFQVVGPATIEEDKQWLDATSTKEERHARIAAGKRPKRWLIAPS